MSSKLALVSVLVMAATALAGCDRSSAPVADAAGGRIHGEAFYLERIAPPDGAVLHLALAGAGAGESAPALLEHSVPVAGSTPPFRFEFPLAPGQVDPALSLVLRASLRDGEGRTWFASRGEHPVSPDQAEQMQIRLVRSADSEPAATAAAAAVADAALAVEARQGLRCGERLVDARFGEDEVRLTVDGVEHVLAGVPSASGARYAGTAMGFWTARGAAMLTIGDEQFPCLPSAEVSPWEQARARGIRFRAVGNEPGWSVEIGAGPTPDMVLAMADGSPPRRFEQTRMLDQGRGYRGRDAIGVAQLHIVDADCPDSMSGHMLPARVELDLGGLRYAGCGMPLEPVPE